MPIKDSSLFACPLTSDEGSAACSNHDSFICFDHVRTHEFVMIREYETNMIKRYASGMIKTYASDMKYVLITSFHMICSFELHNYILSVLKRKTLVQIRRHCLILNLCSIV